MRVLLDTHTLLWWATNDPRLSRKAFSILSSFETDIFVMRGLSMGSGDEIPHRQTSRRRFHGGGFLCPS